MARKDRRQTKRERKELARRRKLEEIRRAKRRQRARRMTGLVVVLAVIAGVAFYFIQSGRAGREARRELNALAEKAGCSALQSPTIEGFQHISPPQTVSYRTQPPTSGNHYGVGAPGPTGVLANPVQNEIQVHNLEHGHVSIQYNGLDEALQKSLEAIVDGTAVRTAEGEFDIVPAGTEPLPGADEQFTVNEWAFIAPYPQMTHKVAFTAWGELLGCDAPNEQVTAVAEKFIETHRDKGRESFPGQPAGAPQGQPGQPPAGQGG